MIPWQAPARLKMFAAPSALVGLTEAEAIRRRARGEGNDVALSTSRSYAEIIRENVFSFVNNILFALGAALVALGRPGDALVSVGIVTANALVGVVQEVRAKRTLDRIAFLSRPTVTLVRDGREQAADPGEIVLGDLVVVRPGDQIVADGRVIRADDLEIDESLLTGESDLIAKHPGDPVYSGSLCSVGQGYYEAGDVGARSLAHRLAVSARAFRRQYTPLQREINLLIRVVLLIAVFLELLLVVDAAITYRGFVDLVRRSVVVIGLVPNGLVLAIAVAYGAGALRMVGRGILVQQANAIESLSQVDVLCLDKTGTLTTGQHRVGETRPIGIPAADFERYLGDFAANVTAPNRTIQAVARAFPGRERRIRVEVPFASERRWSALGFAGADVPDVLVLGAPEILGGHLSPATGVEATVAAWSERGLRVMLLARGEDPTGLRDERGDARLPAVLVPLGLIGLSDELRSGARDALDAFASAGIRLKLISGDNPFTVAALANQIGLATTGTLIDGSDLIGAEGAALARVAQGTTIFGRITPQQKKDLVEALRQHGHHVAMIGDGVNDVVALKQADLGIALGSGSPAARAVADLVLLGDSFGALPDAFRDGQRIRNGMQDVLKLFLTRVFYVALLLVATGSVGEFPLGPKHNALLTLFTVGIPSLALAAWARPGPTSAHPLRAVLHVVLPAALTLTLAALAVHLLFYLGAGQPWWTAIAGAVTADAVVIAQSALTTFAVVCGLLLLVFVAPPTAALGDGVVPSRDPRPSFLALGLLVAYVGILLSPSLRQFFDLNPLPAVAYVLLVALTLLWAATLRWVWRIRLVERYLGIDTTSSVPGKGS